jgi:hypothetical protein
MAGYDDYQHRAQWAADESNRRRLESQRAADGSNRGLDELAESSSLAAQQQWADAEWCERYERWWQEEGWKQGR